MLFLLNDVVFRLEDEAAGIALTAERFRGLTFPSIIRLGQELYAEDPLLQRWRPERARRLAALIVAKVPVINGARFTAPAFDCPPDAVTVRFVNAQFEVMVEFYTRQRDGDLLADEFDDRLWRRLAS